MWDDGNAVGIGQLMVGLGSTPSGAVSRSLGRLKRSISSTVNKLKGKQP